MLVMTKNQQGKRVTIEYAEQIMANNATMNILLVYEGGTPETRFAFPPMPAKDAFKRLYEKLNMLQGSPLLHPIWFLPLQKERSQYPDGFLEKYLHSHGVQEFS